MTDLIQALLTILLFLGGLVLIAGSLYIQFVGIYHSFKAGFAFGLISIFLGPFAFAIGAIKVFTGKNVLLKEGTS